MAVVIKVGGDLVSDPGTRGIVAAELRALRASQVDAVVVHGGGPQATELTQRLGLSPNVVGGRRITSPDVLEVMKMTLGGAVNVDFTAACRAAGVSALGIAGISAGIIRAVRRPPRIVSGCGDEPVDFGEVGDVESVNVEAIDALLSAGFVPVMSSLSADDAGRVLNINADIVACKVAVALKADALVLLTGADGVLVDLERPETRIPELGVARAKQMIADGIVYGGMIPKLEEAFAVIAAGVPKVIIMKVGTVGRLSSALQGSTAAGTILHA